MADNVTIPASGTGDTTPVVATDQVGTAHFQKVKIADGTADSSAMIGGDATNGLDVDVTRVQGTVTVAGAVTIPPQTVFVSSFPSTQPVSGTVTANAGTGPFTVTSQSGIQVQISGGVALTSTATVQGTVSIAGTVPVQPPASQTVFVSSFPSTQPISGTVALSPAPTVFVSSFPSTQPVSGNVSVVNNPTVFISSFPSTQPVNGTVSIGNSPTVFVSSFPSTQAVSGAVTTTPASGSIQSVTGGVAVASTVTVQGTVNANVTSQSGTQVQISGPVALASTATVTGTVSATQSGAWSVATTPAGGSIQSITGNVALASTASVNVAQVNAIAVPSNGAAVNPYSQAVSGVDQITQAAHIFLTDTQGALIPGGASGAVLASVVTVGVSAVPLPATSLVNRKALSVLSEPSNTGTIYLGGPAVLATTGFILTPGQSQPYQIGTATLYGVASIANQQVRVVEVS